MVAVLVALAVMLAAAVCALHWLNGVSESLRRDLERSAMERDALQKRVYELTGMVQRAQRMLLEEGSKD